MDKIKEVQEEALRAIQEASDLDALLQDRKSVV